MSSASTPTGFLCSPFSRFRILRAKRSFAAAPRPRRLRRLVSWSMVAASCSCLFSARSCFTSASSRRILSASEYSCCSGFSNDIRMVSWYHSTTRRAAEQCRILFPCGIILEKSSLGEKHFFYDLRRRHNFSFCCILTHTKSDARAGARFAIAQRLDHIR